MSTDDLAPAAGSYRGVEFVNPAKKMQDDGQGVLGDGLGNDLGGVGDLDSALEQGRGRNVPDASGSVTNDLEVGGGLEDPFVVEAWAP